MLEMDRGARRRVTAPERAEVAEIRSVPAGTGNREENEGGSCLPASPGASGTRAGRPRRPTPGTSAPARVGDRLPRLFSLFPLAIFLVSIFGLLIEDDQRRQEVVTFLVDNFRLSTVGSVRLDEAVAGLTSPTSALGLIAVLGLLWASSGMMAAIRIALTSVWSAEPRQAVAR